MSQDVLTDLLKCNYTELQQIAQKSGLSIKPGVSKEDLAQAIMGLVELPENPIDYWRHVIANFVLDNWTMCHEQITCPLQSQDPRSCFGCPDARVISCFTDSEQHYRTYQLRRK